MVSEMMSWIFRRLLLVQHLQVSSLDTDRHTCCTEHTRTVHPRVLPLLALTLPTTEHTCTYLTHSKGDGRSQAHTILHASSLCGPCALVGPSAPAAFVLSSLHYQRQGMNDSAAEKTGSQPSLPSQGASRTSSPSGSSTNASENASNAGVVKTRFRDQVRLQWKAVAEGNLTPSTILWMAARASPEMAAFFVRVPCGFNIGLKEFGEIMDVHGVSGCEYR